MPSPMPCHPRVGGGDQAHRDRPEDERIHCVEQARPSTAGPWVGRLRFGDDRLHLRGDGRHLLVALKLEQLELGFSRACGSGMILSSSFKTGPTMASKIDIVGFSLRGS
jgi:hypothetical protein